MLDQRKRKLHFMYLLPLPVTSPLLDFQWQVFVHDPIYRLRASYSAPGFHRNISSRCGQCPIRHIARLQVCSNIFNFPLRFLFGLWPYLCWSKTACVVALCAPSDLCLISHGAAKRVRGRQGHGVALTLLWRAHVSGCWPGVKGLFEGFSKLKPLEEQQQRGGAVTLQVVAAGLLGTMWQRCCFGKDLSGPFAPLN